MKYYIQQLGNKDCGITALKILLANIYKRKDFLFYPEANLNESLSLEQLITIAKNEGVELKGYRIKNKEEIKLLKNKKILVILIRNGISHIVNVDKIGTKYIKVYDSSLGFIKYKYKDFYKLFSGEFLEVISVKGSNYKHKDKTLMPLKYKLVILGIQLISFLLLAVTFFFVNEEFSFGKKVKIDLKDMNIIGWKEDLLADTEILQGLLRNLSKVTVKHDSKLQDLITLQILSEPLQSEIFVI